MSELRISRRTLQRWIDDLNIEPKEFEGQMRSFLTLPDIEDLYHYRKIMRTRDRDLITRYRDSIDSGNNAWTVRIRKELLCR